MLELWDFFPRIYEMALNMIIRKCKVFFLERKFCAKAYSPNTVDALI